MTEEPKVWAFLLTLQGRGDTPAEAWQDAVESFTQDPGDFPEPRIKEDDFFNAIEGHALIEE